MIRIYTSPYGGAWSEQVATPNGHVTLIQTEHGTIDTTEATRSGDSFFSQLHLNGLYYSTKQAQIWWWISEP